MGKSVLIASFVALFAAGSAIGGTFATITLDGNFADWVDIPVLVSDEEELTAGVDYAEIKVANDDTKLYVYMRLHRDANPFAYFPDESNYFVDGDNVTSTGFQAYGGLVGSEIFIQGSDAYQEAGGGFNEGALAAGTVLQSPFGVSASEFEFSIDLDVVGVSGAYDGLSLITGNVVSFVFNGSDQVGDTGTNDQLVFSYTMANPPLCIDIIPTSYKTITIDGDFDDWFNVPAAAVDPEEPTHGVDFDVIRIANDADYIYVYMSLHTPGYPFSYFPDETSYFIDGDNNIATGMSVFGGILGSELMIQGPDSFQQAGGGWNEGTLPAATVAIAPLWTTASEFEMAIDRNVLGVAGAFVGQPLITGSTIVLAIQGTDQPGDQGTKDELVISYDLIDSVCPGAYAPAGTDAQGRPLGDLNGDCKVDLVDFAVFQENFTGP